MSEQQPEQPAQKPNGLSRRAQWIAVIAVIAVIGGCSMLISSNGPSQADTDHDAKRVCQGFVEDRLKSPGSAQFSDVAVSHVVDDYTVAGSVDSQNSFGASVRNNFTCEIVSSADQWRLTSLTGLTN